MRHIPAFIHRVLESGEAWLFAERARVYLLFGAVGFLLYARTFIFGYTYLDDHVLILDNIPFLSDFGNIATAFTQDVFFMTNGTTAYFRPLLTLSFMPEAIVGGSFPFFFHAANLGIHLAAVCLAYAVFTKLRYSKRVSLLLSLILLVHPVLTQAVAWIPGRNDSLLAVFALASFYFIVDYIDSPRRGPIIWSAFFFLLALFTKETAIVLPVLFTGYLCTRRRLDRTALIEFGAGWLIAILMWLPLRITAMSHPLDTTAAESIASFVNNVPGTLQLLGKAFSPFNLSVLPILQDTTFVWGYAAAALIALILLLRLWNGTSSARSSLMMLFGFAWFLLFLWPPFILSDPSGATSFLEHRLYLPFIGLLMFFAETSLLQVLDEPAGGWLLAPWLFVLITFASITFVHEGVFSDRLTFWQSAAASSLHSSFTQKNLGAMYYLDKEYSLAETYSRRALALNPRETMVHNNLGLIYAALGRREEAEQEYLRELAFNPYYDSAHYNLGLLYYQQGDFAAAKREWEEALSINPGYADALQGLWMLSIEGKKGS